MSHIDCLIISVGRAASTAVYHYINQMGNLKLPANKEPHFYCDITPYKGIYQLLLKLKVSTEMGYEELYGQSSFRIDASVGYFYCIDEVIEKLRRYDEKPKVIFLYREPVSRAASLFNELRKKEITQSINIEEDLAKKREPGYWWEYYYDNVAYFDVYKRIEAYFDFVLSINYELFSQQTDIVMNRILEFLGIEKQTEIDYVRYNSSSEANIVHKLRSFMWLASVVPWRLRALLRIYIRRRAGRYASLRNNSFENNLIFSMDQYDSFRNYVNHKDIICIMK